MKHSDEQQTFSPEKEAKRAKYMPNVDQLISDHEHLLIRSREESKQILQLRSELDELERQLAAARKKSATERADNVKLRKTLAALRQSKSVKTGRAVTLPARIILKAVRRTSAGRNNFSVRPAQIAVALSTQPSQTPEELRNVYRAEIAAENTAYNVMRFINHAYFVMGDISEPASLIEANGELLTDLSVKDERLIRIIMGLAELMTKEPELPPRQPNAGYQVERDRILYCAHSTGHFNSNGYSTRTAGVIGGLKQQGKDVVTMARPGYPWDVKVDVAKPPVARFSKTINGVEHVYNPCLSWTNDRLDHYLTAATDTYVREAQRQRASLIHSASNYVTALPALTASRRLGIPFTYEVRGLWEITGASEKPGWEESERYKFSERMETFVARNADHVFAITQQIKDELVRRGVEASKISLLPNSVDTSEFTPMPPYLPLRKKWNLPADVPVIGYAGSLVHYEGLSDLLKATRQMIDAGRHVRLIVVGDGPEMSSLKTEANDLHLTEAVIFTGRVPAAEIPMYISLFDVMPCPRISLPVTELVSPLKPLEAMASGKALVLTSVAPLRDLAEGDTRAVVVEHSNPKSLADGILRLLDDPELRQELGRRARLWTVETRTWNLVGELAVGAYKDVLKTYYGAAENAVSLRNVRVAIVADTFTTEGLRPETDLLELRPDTWKQQMEESPVDALFVESAWEGINDEWHQRVGFYGDEQFSVVQGILDYCRKRSIPTIFWNKEDPVHFSRFKNSAKHFDHIFTTDANCITEYSKVAGPYVKSIASLPFYAQPKIHNPLPSTRSYEHSVAYAGTYYGARYKERSAELAQLLDAVKPYGLSIYDRQLLNPNSPYQFPADLIKYVSGGLSYLDMVEAYKTHPVHINVNSVASSPTMFSRRVVEVAASGSTVISGRGRGVDDVLGGLIHSVTTKEEAAVLAERWMTNEAARITDAWLAYRLVHRGHTAAHRLAYVLRTAGLVVEAPSLRGYALRTENLTPEAVEAVNTQTILPNVIIYERADEAVEVPDGVVGVRAADVTVEFLRLNGVAWIGAHLSDYFDRTSYEDLLTAERFGAWDEISFTSEALETPGLTLAVPGVACRFLPHLRSLENTSDRGQKACLQMRREISTTDRRKMGTRDTEMTQGVAPQPRTILVAGHDLKFAQGIIMELKAQGHNVLVDQWTGHTQHDEELSRKLLLKADIVFCEWTLGNAVWYADNVSPHQYLVTRLHSQELFTPYLKMLNNQRVDQIMVVGQHVADLAVRDHGIPESKLVIIPNSVQVPQMEKSKDEVARYRIGLVGIVPAQKHLDRALDVLVALRKIDSRYTLAIKGKLPEDYSWMAQRTEEMAYYEEQYERLRSDPLLVGAVTFDGFGDDMSEWYQSIGVVLSVSDFESFHLTIADGAAHGALPAVLGWPGADQIYPSAWISSSISEIVERISVVSANKEYFDQLTSEAHAFVEASFSSEIILPKITATMLNQRGRRLARDTQSDPSLRNG